MRNASAKVTKVTRSNGSGGKAAATRGSSGDKDADPWASSSPGGYSDEPPF